MTEEELKHLKSDCEYFLNGSDKGEINLYNFIENLRTTYIEPKGKRIAELEKQIEKMKCLNEEIIKALNECLDYEWLPAHNGKAKYLYLQTVLDIVNEKFRGIKEN